MNKNFARVALPFCLAASIGGAHAANIVSIEGAHAVYYFDADIWGDNTASVTGDTLSFSLSTDFTLNGTVTLPTAGRTKSFELGNDPFGIVAVAKTGYRISTAVTAGLQGEYYIADNGSTIRAINSGYTAGGSYTGGAFTKTSNGGFFDYREYKYSDYVTPNGLPHSGNFNDYAGSYRGDANSADAVRINQMYVSASVQQSGPGISGLSFTNASFNFNLIPRNHVSAVPEPASYAMCLAGLAVVAMRRRKAGA